MWRLLSSSAYGWFRKPVYSQEHHVVGVPLQGLEHLSRFEVPDGVPLYVVCSTSPFARFQIRAVSSQLPVGRLFPSGLKVTDLTSEACLSKVCSNSSVSVHPGWGPPA